MGVVPEIKNDLPMDHAQHEPIVSGYTSATATQTRPMARNFRQQEEVCYLARSYSGNMPGSLHHIRPYSPNLFWSDVKRVSTAVPHPHHARTRQHVRNVIYLSGVLFIYGKYGYVERFNGQDGYITGPTQRRL
jgi:hypothetical protein